MEYIGIGIAIVVVIAFFKTIRIVPQKSAYIVERLGQYSRTLDAGFYILIPFLDKIAYKRSLKEEALTGRPRTRKDYQEQHGGFGLMEVNWL